MFGGGNPMAFVDLAYGADWEFANAVLERMGEIYNERHKKMMDELVIVVQNGVARAHGGR